MKIIKLLMIMILLCRYGQAIKAQDVTVVTNPTSGCKEGGSVGIVATANAVPLGGFVYWSLFGGGDFDHLNNRTLNFTMGTGVYIFTCRYGSATYNSDPINITVYQNNVEVCGDKYWPEWYAGNYITTCDDGVNVIKDEYDAGELFLKANNSITLLPGFTANTGTLVEARIAPVCSPNTYSDYYDSYLRKGEINTEIETNGISNSSIYPNPSSGDFMLDLNFPESRNVDIAVTDVTGKEVYKNKLGFIDMASLDIDLSTEKPGLYLVKITSDSNTEFQKVVISK